MLLRPYKELPDSRLVQRVNSLFFLWKRYRRPLPAFVGE